MLLLKIMILESYGRKNVSSNEDVGENFRFDHEVNIWRQRVGAFGVLLCVIFMKSLKSRFIL